MAALPALASSSCRSTDATAIVVHVTSDQALGLDSVDLTATPATSGAAAAKTVHFPNPASVTWVLSPSGSDKMFALEVEARGMKTGTSSAVVSQRADVSFQNGRRIEITMTLTAACMGK